MSTPESPFVSVIVPVYNGEATIDACLRAIDSSTHTAYEVVVVNDGSTDRTAMLAAGYPCRLLQLEKNLGPAAARNRGASVATGQILFFLDADITIEPDTIARVAAAFRDQPDVDAVFCSYKDTTAPTNFVSDFKNLLHHYTHQTAQAQATTFCGGYGGIRRQVFEAIGGFDATQRSLEDIELGYRLYHGGHTTRLLKDIQVTHWKTYSLVGLIRSDVLHRAIPWTRIMLEKRIVRNDLNTKLHNVLSVPVSYAILVAAAALLVAPKLGVFALITLLITFVALNTDFLRFAWRRRGTGFALRAALLLWFGYVYSGIGLLLGVGAYIAGRRITS